MKGITLRFLRSASPYTSGEVATFEAEQAKQMIQAGIAEQVTLEPVEVKDDKSSDVTVQQEVLAGDAVHDPEAKGSGGTKRTRNRMIRT